MTLIQESSKLSENNGTTSQYSYDDYHMKFATRLHLKGDKELCKSQSQASIEQQNEPLSIEDNVLIANHNDQNNIIIKTKVIYIFIEE